MQQYSLMKAQNIPYVKVEGDPKKQAEGLRQFFPGTGVPVGVPKPTAPLSDDVEMQRLDLGYQKPKA